MKLSFGLALFFIGVFSLIYGYAPWSEVWPHALMRLLGKASGWNPLLDERIPRLIVLFSTGAALTVAGVVVQALFQNPLASPSLLGLTAGGGLFILIAFWQKWHLDSPWIVPFVACLGAFLSLFLVFGLALKKTINQSHALLLSGLALTSFLMAIQGALLYAWRDQWELVQTIVEWEAASSAHRNWHHVHMQLPLTLVGLYGCYYYRIELNLLSLGEQEALSLGVDVAKVRWRLALCVALLVGGSLASLGSVPFLGLALPHILRKLKGADHSTLLIFSMAGGAIVLASTDLALRVLALPMLSLGTLSSLAGALFFMGLLWKNREPSYVAY